MYGAVLRGCSLGGCVIPYKVSHVAPSFGYTLCERNIREWVVGGVVVRALPRKLVPTDIGCDGLPSPAPLLKLLKEKSVERLTSGPPGTPGSSGCPSLAAGAVDKRLTRLSILDASSAVPLNRIVRVSYNHPMV